MILGAGLRSEGQNTTDRDVPVTAVTGESWLNHIHRPFAETSMGKTWRLGPAAPRMADLPQGGQPMVINSSGNVTLHGSDLYRLNCRSCHGESGQGAPPEINSLIDPVRATSARVLMERMKSTGQEISGADATTMAKQSRAALLQRLHDGGEKMPAFQHLNAAEIRSLMAYLKQLAGMDHAEKEQATVNESPVRIGELIVKSTCHICHSAVGRNPTPEQLLNGAIPPLSSFPTRVDEEGLIRKVTNGATIAMGTPPMLYRGRMPVFDYLSEQEAAYIYLYLTTYPPSEHEARSAAIALATHDTASSSGPPPPQVNAAEANALASKSTEPPQEAQAVFLLAGVALFVLSLLAGGLGYSMYECQRLGAESERRNRARANAYVMSAAVRERALAQRVEGEKRRALLRAAK